MKKTYATSMPNHIGSFLKASRCFAALGINITRVSYNKAVDTHTLFIEVDGQPEKILEADRRLADIGYLQNDDGGHSIILLEFRLRDEPGSVIRILELIKAFNFNISYMSSQENGTEYQLFKMGLYVEDRSLVEDFLRQAETICGVRVLDYNRAEKTFDNSIFYQSYATALASCMDIQGPQREELLIHVNLAMQVLDERGLSPYRTFDSISRFAELLARHRNEAFVPRIMEHPITDQTTITVIEPPCGSNITFIHSGEEYLFVDTGYACYQEETLEIFRRLIPDFDTIPKHALLTHADVDHCGMMNAFDEVFVSHNSARSLTHEAQDENGFREQNPLHRPYVNICKILTSYATIDPKKLRTPWVDNPALKEPLTQIGFFDFGDLHFEVYEGKGGHLPGEVVLIDYNNNIVFTGDVYINTHGLTAEQAEYNQYAPILMTSVDTDPQLCGEERKAIMRRLGVGNWKIFGAHGAPKDYCVK